MAIWNSISPNGALSVKQNTLPLQQNTAYTETQLDKDHFWNKGANQNGHHRFVQTEATNVAAPTTIVNPALANSMNLALFSRIKPITESVSRQVAEPFIKNLGGDAFPYLSGVAQLLGIRAMAMWYSTNALGVQPLKYSFNVDTVNCTNASGSYTATYLTGFPAASGDYLVFGGGVAKTTANVAFSLSAGGLTSNAPTSKTLSNCMFSITPGTLLQGWFICFGG